MAKDVFGNLAEWDRVRTTLGELHRASLMDEHQAGMARILRYRDNRQLLVQVLGLTYDIRQASELLIAEVLNLLVDDDVCLEYRVMAVNSLVHLVPRWAGSSDSTFDIGRVHRTVEALLLRPGAPLLHDAVAGALAALRSASR